MKDLFIGIVMGVVVTISILVALACPGQLTIKPPIQTGVLISHIDDLPSTSLEEQLLLRELVRPHGFRQQPLPPMPNPFPRVPLYNWQNPCP